MSSQAAGPAVRSKRQWVLLGLLSVFLFSASYTIGTRLMSPSPTSGPASAIENAGLGVGTVDPPHLLHDFTLTSHTGDSISLSDLRGKTVLMFFGYTHCPDVCPGTLAEYKDVKRRLGAAAENVSFVFISVDGERDTPERLAEYLEMFDSDFIGMTGDAATLRALGNEYGLFFEQDALPGRSTEQSAANAAHGHASEALADHEHDDDALDQDNYFVQHTSPSFLVDRDGYLRTLFFFGTSPATVADTVGAMIEASA